MAANFAKPISTDNYLDVLTTLRDNMTDLAKMFDGSSATNIPTGAIRWSTANKRFEQYNGSSWTALMPVATQSADGLLAAADKVKIDALGTASTEGKQASAYDTTANALMAVGAFGLGSTAPLGVSAAAALDAIANTQVNTVSSANRVTVGGPAGTGGGVVLTIRFSAANAIQFWYDVSGDYKEYRRTYSTTWGVWREFLRKDTLLNTDIPVDTTHRWATDALITAWNAAKTHADSAHAPSNAQPCSAITKAEIETKLIGAITSHTHAYLPSTGGTVSGSLIVTGVTDSISRKSSDALVGAVSSGAITLDFAAGNSKWYQLNGATQFTLANAVATSTMSMMLYNAGSFAVTWPAGIMWPKGTAPTLTVNGYDMILIIHMGSWVFGFAVTDCKA